MAGNLWHPKDEVVIASGPYEGERGVVTAAWSGRQDGEGTVSFVWVDLPELHVELKFKQSLLRMPLYAMR